MTSISARRIFFLAIAVPLAAPLIGGCVSSSEKTTSIPAPPTVAVPSDREVVAPSTVVVTPSSGRVITYPEGRYELRGDGSGGYYWAWIPAGTTLTSPPPPPALPRTGAATGPVIVSRTERIVPYAEGRYELHGDSTTGYYWVWIPATFMPPAPPPPPWRMTEGR